MNETEKERILRMVSEGTLRPAEASHLLAALAEEPASPADTKKKPENGAAKEEEKPKQPLIEVQMQRPDGSNYTVQVPPNLFPMFWQIAKVAIKESARTAANETWDGFKTMVYNKTQEVKATVKAKVSGSRSTDESPAATAEAENQFEARQRILQMVQNGRISATDASRLIQQLDALHDYQKAHPVSNLPAPAKN